MLAGPGLATIEIAKNTKLKKYRSNYPSTKTGVFILSYSQIIEMKVLPFNPL
tara:strand:+ start:420 stop:575 length:156 start_codon:yes stop_codon:yes gene_type:complete